MHAANRNGAIASLGRVSTEFPNVVWKTGGKLLPVGGATGFGLGFGHGYIEILL